jgi:hypothetical protein
VIVYDVDADVMREVSEAEAAQGMLRYARGFPAGSAVRGEIERQALAVMPAPRQRKPRRDG